MVTADDRARVHSAIYPKCIQIIAIRDEIERRHGTAIHLDYSRTAREINLNARWAGRRGSVVQYISSSMRFIQEWKRQERERKARPAGNHENRERVVWTCPWFGRPINSGRKSRPRRRQPDRLECETFMKKRVTGRRFLLTHAWSREGAKRPMRAQCCAAILPHRARRLAAGSSVIRKWNHARRTASKCPRMLDFFMHGSCSMIFLLSHLACKQRQPAGSRPRLTQNIFKASKCRLRSRSMDFSRRLHLNLYINRRGTHIRLRAILPVQWKHFSAAGLRFACFLILTSRNRQMNYELVCLAVLQSRIKILVDSILACTYKSVHGNWKEQSLANCVDYPATNFPVLSYLLD